MASSSKHTYRRRALVTGAGSGTGAATAMALARSHDLVLVGRSADRLDAVAAQVRDAGGIVETIVYDVTAMDAASVVAKAGPITDLVLAAGLNSPRRTWVDHTMVEFEQIVATNLIAVADLVSAALPFLRRCGGTVVVISSLSAWITSPGAGVAYRASKSGLRSLTDSLNEQEAAHGVRATHLCPGDIATDFLDQRPQPPTAAGRRRMLTPDDVARAAAFVIHSPAHVRVDELVISPLGTVRR